MSQVQNNILHRYIQPAFLVAIAYVAGSKRFIQYFPGASQGGLCLAAGIGSGIAFISPNIKTPALFKTEKNETAIHSCIRVIISLALGTIIEHVISKGLKGRVNFRFIIFETVYAGLFSFISSMISQKASFSNKKENENSISEEILEGLERFLTIYFSSLDTTEATLYLSFSTEPPLVEDDKKLDFFCEVELTQGENILRGKGLFTYEKASKLFAVKRLFLSHSHLPSTRLLFDVIENPALFYPYPEVLSLLQNPRCLIIIKPLENDARNNFSQEWKFFVPGNQCLNCIVPITFFPDGNGGTIFQISRK